MNLKYIIYCCIIFFIVQTVIWFQLNSQFIKGWDWFKNNPFLLSLLGVPISILLIYGTKLGYVGFNELLWPQRLILFALGIISFSFCTWYFLGENLSTKTIISISIAVILVAILASSSLSPMRIIAPPIISLLTTSVNST